MKANGTNTLADVIKRINENKPVLPPPKKEKPPKPQKK